MTGVTAPSSRHHERNDAGLTHPSLPKLGADLAIWQVLGKLEVLEVGESSKDRMTLEIHP